MIVSCLKLFLFITVIIIDLRHTCISDVTFSKRKTSFSVPKLQCITYARLVLFLVVLLHSLQSPLLSFFSRGYFYSLWFIMLLVEMIKMENLLFFWLVIYFPAGRNGHRSCVVFCSALFQDQIFK